METWNPIFKDEHKPMKILTPISQVEMKRHYKSIVSGEKSVYAFSREIGISLQLAYRLVDRFENGVGFVTIEDLREIACGNTIRMIYKTLVSKNIKCTRKNLYKLLFRYKIDYVKMMDELNKPIDETTYKSIVSTLKNSNLNYRQIADKIGVSESTVKKINKECKCRKKLIGIRREGKRTRKFIEILFESPNYLSAKEASDIAGFDNKRPFFAAISHIRNNPADYSLSIKKTADGTYYKVTHVAEKRKGTAANNKVKRMESMHNKGMTPEEIAKAMKYKKETVSKTLAKDTVEGVRKPGEMNPLMAKFLGIKL